MKTAIAASICLTALSCSKSNPNPTPNGTTVSSWELARSDRAAIRGARTSDAATKKLAYVAHPTDDTAVELALELETATVVFEEDGKEVTHAAPIKLRVDVVDNGDFTIGEGKCMGPHYALAAPGQAPRDMILHCVFKATKPSYDVSFTIYAYGDGRIDDGVAPAKTP